MPYTGHHISLNEQEEKDFQEIKKRTGFGLKKIFMAMIKSLKEPEKEIQEKAINIEEEV